MNDLTEIHFIAPPKELENHRDASDEDDEMGAKESSKTSPSTASKSFSPSPSSPAVFISPGDEIVSPSSSSSTESQQQQPPHRTSTIPRSSSLLRLKLSWFLREVNCHAKNYFITPQ
jgi:hypothetical protein